MSFLQFLDLDLSPYNVSNIDTMNIMRRTAHQKDDPIER